MRWRSSSFSPRAAVRAGSTHDESNIAVASNIAGNIAIAIAIGGVQIPADPRRRTPAGCTEIDRGCTGRSVSGKGRATSTCGLLLVAHGRSATDRMTPACAAANFRSFA